MVGQNKYLKAKFGAVDDEMADDDDKDKDEEDKRVTWGSRKNAYREADNVDFEVRSVLLLSLLLIFTSDPFSSRIYLLYM